MPVRLAAVVADHLDAGVVLVDPALDLLEQVVHNKSLMFADNKASYGTAMIGSLRLVPTDELRARLADDYAAMSEMFMMPPPSFDELMAAIAAMEAKLNG